MNCLQSACSLSPFRKSRGRAEWGECMLALPTLVITVQVVHSFHLPPRITLATRSPSLNYTRGHENCHHGAFARHLCHWHWPKSDQFQTNWPSFFWVSTSWNTRNSLSILIESPSWHSAFALLLPRSLHFRLFCSFDLIVSRLSPLLSCLTIIINLFFSAIRSVCWEPRLL